MICERSKKHRHGDGEARAHLKDMEDKYSYMGNVYPCVSYHDGSCQTSSLSEIAWQLPDDEFDYLNWYIIEYAIIGAKEQIANGEYETYEQVFGGNCVHNMNNFAEILTR